MPIYRIDCTRMMRKYSKRVVDTIIVGNLAVCIEVPKFEKREDEKFGMFKGKRILFDTHDNGSKDGFARFKAHKTPRIKVNPSYKMIERLNIVMSIPFIVDHRFLHPEIERPNKIVCAMRLDNMPEARTKVLDKIKAFNPDSKWLDFDEHAARLCKTLINIVPTGTGDSSRSHIDTLAAGALLMAEESIADIKVLPFEDLKDGENFVSYNLDNVCDKLNWLLERPEKISEIRMNGLETFIDGYDIEKSAKILREQIYAN